VNAQFQRAFQVKPLDREMRFAVIPHCKVFSRTIPVGVRGFSRNIGSSHGTILYWGVAVYGAVVGYTKESFGS
jgi:hypothetical protein